MGLTIDVVCDRSKVCNSSDQIGIVRLGLDAYDLLDLHHLLTYYP